MRVAFLLVLAGCDKLLGLSPVSDPVIPGPTQWIAASTGGSHACGIHADGTLWCWGDNSYDQLGIGGTIEADVPTQVGTATWTAVAAGDYSTCGIQSDASLWCWGLNQRGETGTGERGHLTANSRILGSEYVIETPTSVEGSWLAVDVGLEFACGIQADHSLWCWGDNTYQQTAEPDITLASAVPKLVDAGPWTSVALGAFHACGVRTDGTIWCWGRGSQGQLGISNTLNPDMAMPAPIADVGVARWKQVAAGNRTTCAISDDAIHTVYCWGVVGSADDYIPTPVALGNGTFSDVTDLALGGQDTTAYGGMATMCARRSDRSLWCWGLDHRGQLGPLATGMPYVPQPLPATSDASTWQAITVGWANVCAIDDANALWCRGADALGQLADGGTSHRTPAQVPGTWTHVTAGRSTTCALDGSRHVYCTGNGDDGGIGDGTWDSHAELVPANLAATATSLVVGDRYACAIDDASIAWCWGYDFHGELGDTTNSLGYTDTPTHVIATKFQSGAASMHTCMIDTASALWCWGYDLWFEVGDGGMADVNTPYPLTMTGPWTQVATGLQHTCALNNLGAAYCWGYDGYGELGVGAIPNGAYETSPTPILGFEFTALAAGDAHTCGIDKQKHALCWGYGDHGQLGLDGFGNALSPTQIGSAQWLAIGAGALHSCGIQIDGTLWCWGENTYGQLGDGTIDSRAAPIRAGDTSARWTEIHVGGNHTCATHVDGTLWCWGLNDTGQLGDGTAWREQFVSVP